MTGLFFLFASDLCLGEKVDKCHTVPSKGEIRAHVQPTSPDRQTFCCIVYCRFTFGNRCL